MQKIISLTLILLCIHSSLSMWSTDEEKNIIKAILDRGVYDPTIRPSGDTSTVHITLHVIEILDVNDKTSAFTVKVRLIQRWRDPRLAFTSSSIKYLPLSSPNLVWRPDTIFKNQILSQSRDSINPESNSVRVYPSGEVVYVSTATISLNCPIFLKNYPFDYQWCGIEISSHAMNTDMIEYKWEEGPWVQPVGINKDSFISFTLAAYTTKYCDVLQKTGQVSCASVIFTFKREASYIIATVFVPMMMFLTISIMTMWIKMKDSSMVLIRIVITLTMLIMCSNRADQLNNNGTLPVVNYTKAIDVWTGMCVFFAFMAFVETILASNYREDETSEDKDMTGMGILQKFKNNPINVKIDLVARILLPSFILLFVIGYFFTFASSDVTCPVSKSEEKVTCLIEF